jgi:hypothetical protein
MKQIHVATTINVHKYKTDVYLFNVSQIHGLGVLRFLNFMYLYVCALLLLEYRIDLICLSFSITMGSTVTSEIRNLQQNSEQNA